MKVSILIQLPLIHRFNSPLTEETYIQLKALSNHVSIKGDMFRQDAARGGGGKHPHIFPKMAAPVSLAGKHYF